MTKIERGKKPKGRPLRNINVDFEKLQPGDSFFYMGPRNTMIIRFGYHLAQGRYTTEKEVNAETGEVGWRFYYLGARKKRT